MSNREVPPRYAPTLGIASARFVAASRRTQIVCRPARIRVVDVKGVTVTQPQ